MAGPGSIKLIVGLAGAIVTAATGGVLLSAAANKKEASPSDSSENNCGDAPRSDPPEAAAQNIFPTPAAKIQSQYDAPMASALHPDKVTEPVKEELVAPPPAPLQDTSPQTAAVPSAASSETSSSDAVAATVKYSVPADIPPEYTADRSEGGNMAYNESIEFEVSNGENPDDEAYEYNDDEAFDEEDEYEDDEPEIDNRYLSYQRRPICIRLNISPHSRLSLSERHLCQRFPNFKKLQYENLLQRVVDEVFPDGLQKQVYITNLSFESDKGNFLGIRPEIIDGDFLSRLLPPGYSLQFRGYPSGKMFVVDAVYDVADQGLLCYEIPATVIPYSDQGRVNDNFLYHIVADTDSLVKYTQENLTDWNNYLDWKEQLASVQVKGCKYYKLTYDAEKNRLVFWLACPSQEYFQKFKKYLHRDIQAFKNNYSSDPWKFQFADDAGADKNKKKWVDRGIELGRYRGIVKEYALAPASDAEFSDDSEPEESDFNDPTLAEAALRHALKTPYIVQVAFELNRADQETINELNLQGSEIADYVRDNVIGNYEPNGFLALSAIGDLVLIKRFRMAIHRLENYECTAPTLAVWLFNVSQARLPTEKEFKDLQIQHWLNPAIAANENQQEAVRKMLAAPDLCLIQGPPGTGKTTVIAEAIYQFALRGNRILVASQSNDAVDNALDRLANTPVIRAVRLGQKGRRKRRTDKGVVQKFSEDAALGNYYQALSQQISTNRLDPWQELDAKANEYQKAIRDAEYFNQDIDEFNQELALCTEKIIAEKKNYSDQNEALKNANEANQILQAERLQLQQLIDAIRQDGKDTIPFSLTDAQLQILQPILAPVLCAAKAQGIFLIPAEQTLDTGNAQVQNELLSTAIRRGSALPQLLEKAEAASAHGSTASSDSQALLLQKESIQEKIVALLSSDEDFDQLARLRSEFQRIQKMLQEQHGGSVIVLQSEQCWLSKNLQDALNNDHRDEAIRALRSVDTDWKAALEHSVAQLSEWCSAQTAQDTAPIREALRISEGRLKTLQNSLNELNDKIQRKKNTLAELSARYGLTGADIDSVLSGLHALQKKNLDQKGQVSDFRTDWESTLLKFRQKLDDPDTAVYDQKYYQSDYLQSCNVVGISCTDDMRNLSSISSNFDAFDVVIIDEVSKATPPELLIPLMRARKAILVGDHRQLPPMFNEHEKTYTELLDDPENSQEELRSLLTKENFDRFKKMVTASLFKEYFEKADDRIKHSLLTQYRMHSDIMQIINRFYDNRLQNGLSPAEEAVQRSHGLTIPGVDGSAFIRPDSHAYWIDSSHLPNGKNVYETYLRGSSSACNLLEVALIIELLKKLADACRADFAASGVPRSVGVISFYQMQISELWRALRDERKQGFDFSPLQIDMNTVDRFQGKEKSIIITSLVRNNSKARAGEHVISFERINVAFSRAQNLLIIVGAKHLYERLQVKLPNMDSPGSHTVRIYQNIMDDLNRKASLAGSEKLITPELEQRILACIQESGEAAK